MTLMRTRVESKTGITWYICDAGHEHLTPEYVKACNIESRPDPKKERRYQEWLKEERERDERRRWLRERPGAAPIRWTPERNRQLIELRTRGATWKEIATIYDRCKEAVRRAYLKAMWRRKRHWHALAWQCACPTLRYFARPEEERYAVGAMLERHRR